MGRGYFWLERIGWTDEQIRTRLGDRAVSLHLLSVAGAPAGYFELEAHRDGSVEVVYFGLLPEFQGRGLGKYLLTEAAETAWALGASRVWLHTCTLDHPGALANYLARGFQPFRTETREVDLPGMTAKERPSLRRRPLRHPLEAAGLAAVERRQGEGDHLDGQELHDRARELRADGEA